MLEENLRKLLRGRRRLWVVITLSLAIGLLTVGPLVDQYADIRQKRQELTDRLEAERLVAENLPSLRERVGKQSEKLRATAARGVSGESVQEFRSWLVNSARSTGCQVRRIELGAQRTRDWLKDDDPLVSSRPKATKKNETPFELRSQAVSLSVSGTLYQVKQFLSQLDKTGKLFHTRRLSLRPGGVHRREVLLELDLELFDLTRKQSQTA